jgi:peptidoglycan/LPS O-acetylase OafA/YrhL
VLGEVSYSFFLTHGVVIALFFRPDGKYQERTYIDVQACLAGLRVRSRICPVSMG